MLKQTTDASLRRWLERRLTSETFSEFILDIPGQITIVHALVARVENLKTVERVAMTGGVDFCLGDGITDTLKKTANAREEVLLVAHINHHLQSFAGGRQTCFNHRFVSLDSVVQQACMPSDLIRVVAQEIGRIKLRPQFFRRLFLDGI